MSEKCVVCGKNPQEIVNVCYECANMQDYTIGVSKDEYWWQAMIIHCSFDENLNDFHANGNTPDEAVKHLFEELNDVTNFMDSQEVPDE